MTAKLLHVSDSLVGGRQVTSDGDASLGGVELAVQRAIDREVDAVVHTGNLFRQPTPDDDVVAAVGDALDELPAGVPFLVIEGGRETYGDGDAVDRLREYGPVEKLTAEPTLVGDVALWGVDHSGDVSTFLDRLGDLEPTDEYTHNAVCVNQRVWPPLWEETADLSAYDLMDETAVHVDAVLAGGFEEPRRWESEDFDYQVVYAGSTNPEKLDAGATPQGTLVEASAEDGSYDHVALATSGVDGEIAHLRRALEFEPSDVEDRDVETLADLYGLAARAKSVFEQRRKDLRDELLERVDADGEIDGSHATVDRRTRRRRSLCSEDEVFDAVERAGVDSGEVTTVDISTLDSLVDSGEIPEESLFETVERAGIDRDEVLTVDSTVLDTLVAAGEINEDDVFEIERSPYVRVKEVVSD